MLIIEGMLRVLKICWKKDQARKKYELTLSFNFNGLF